jgi:hypothetical protein
MDSGSVLGSAQTLLTSHLLSASRAPLLGSYCIVYDNVYTVGRACAYGAQPLVWRLGLGLVVRCACSLGTVSVLNDARWQCTVLCTFGTLTRRCPVRLIRQGLKLNDRCIFES